VACVDTSLAHLAGALGRPVDVLLPFAPDWRWLLGRRDSPWYASATLHRQDAPGDWSAALASLARDLSALARDAG
jgi:ADP-heptose:LPS heptosyltransferase